MAVRSTLALWSLAVLAGCGLKEESVTDSSEPTETGSEEGTVAVAPDSEGIRWLPSGLGIETLDPGDGAKPVKGDTVEVHYTGRLKDGGDKFDSSVDRGTPFSFPIGKGRVIAGWDEGIAELQVGEKAKLHIPSNLGYGARGSGRIPPNADLVFDVELLGIVEMDKFETPRGEIRRLESGLGIEMLKKGDGPQVKKGDVAQVHYTGWLTNGTQFDSSRTRGQPFVFPVGRGQVIRGWDQGVAEMKVGDKVRLYVPSDLGYGVRGSGRAIPPNADLIFAVELLGIQ